jgi:hypothetical protein
MSTWSKCKENFKPPNLIDICNDENKINKSFYYCYYNIVKNCLIFNINNILVIIFLFLNIFFGVPHLATFIFNFSLM